MTPTHALIAIGAFVLACGAVLAVAIAAAGRTDDRDGRPRG